MTCMYTDNIARFLFDISTLITLLLVLYQIYSAVHIASFFVAEAIYLLLYSCISHTISATIEALILLVAP